MTIKPALQEMLKGTLNGKERPWVRVRKEGNTKAVKISISVKISQGTCKIKQCKVWHHIPKTSGREE